MKYTIPTENKIILVSSKVEVIHKENHTYYYIIPITLIYKYPKSLFHILNRGDLIDIYNGLSSCTLKEIIEELLPECPEIGTVGGRDIPHFDM